MNRSIVRNSIDSLTDLAAQAPNVYRIVNSVSDYRRRQRANRFAREASWLGAGLALGAGLTTLFAPKTGAEVRKSLSEQAGRMRKSIAEKTHGAARTARKELS
jgi:hypothetical protein